MDYSIEKRLKELSNIDDRYDKVYSLWCINKKIYSDALASVSYYYPHYSLHDASHSESIVSKIEMILGEERIKDLGPTDLFLILMCAYSHDIGMIITNTDIEEILKDGEFVEFIRSIKEASYSEDLVQAAEYLIEIESNPISIKNIKNTWALETKDNVMLLLAEFFRKRHGARGNIDSNELKDKNINNILYGNLPERIIKLIGTIDSFHTLEFGEILENLKQETNGLINDIAHPRFVACMLRLGDLLDLDDGRFNPVFKRLLLNFPKSSETHMKKHRSIVHFLVTEEKIEVEAICKQDENDVYLATRQWFEWLKDELRNLNLYWSKIVPKGFKGTAPVDNEIHVNLKDNSMKELVAIKFNISSENAFELFEGNNLYNDRLVFIRELIQNSLDASKLQMWKDINTGMYDNIYGLSADKEGNRDYNFISDIPNEIYKFYPICITLKKEDNDEFSFIIEDNGRGIGKEDIKRICNVGESYLNDTKAKELIKSIPYWLKPTGNFGIGLQSVFQVTKSFKAETKSDNDSQGYIFKFQSRKDKGYIESKINDNKYVKRGTKISFKIKEEDLKEHFESADMGILQEIMGNKMSFDYFADRNEKMIAKYILEYINNIMYGEMLFPLVFKLENINDVLENNRIEMKNNRNKGLVRANDLEYLIELDDSGIIQIKAFDKKTKSEIIIEFFKFDIVQLYLNGIIVNNSFVAPCLGIKWNTFGYSPKELLKFSRDEIKPNMNKILEDELVNNIIPRCIKQVKEYIKDKEVQDKLKDYKDLRNYKESIFYLRLANGIYLREEEIDNDIWDKICDYPIPELWVNKSNEEDFFKIKSFIRCVEKCKYDYEAFSSDTVISEAVNGEYIAEINPSLEMDIKGGIFVDSITEMTLYGPDNTLINCIELQKYLENNFYVQSIKKLEKDKYLLIIERGRFKSIKVDKEIANEIIKDLYYEEVIRTRIYTIDTEEINFGEILAVNKMPPLIGDNRGMLLRSTNRLGFDNHFIISPFIGHNKCTFDKKVEDIIQWLKDKAGLNELIQWVYKNSINKKSVEEVEKAYYKLVEYYIYNENE